MSVLASTSGGSQNRPAHFIGIPIAPWGHFRPLLHTSLNLLALHPELHFTLLVAPSAHPRVTAELALPSLAHLHRSTSTSIADSHKEPSAGSAESGKVQAVQPVVDRMQVIEVVDPALTLQKADASAVERSGNGLADEDEMFHRMLPVYLDTLWRADGCVFPDGGPNRFNGTDPGFIVYDTIQLTIPTIVPSITERLGKPTPYLFGFGPYCAGNIYRLNVPADLGGQWALMRDRAEASMAKGTDKDTAWSNEGWTGHGKVWKLPGYPDKYDWEWNPQSGSSSFPAGMWPMLSASQEAALHPAVTGVIAPVCPELEEETQAAAERDLGKKCLLLGLQFPAQLWDLPVDHITPIPSSPGTPELQRVVDFLETTLKTHGPHTLFYASFGSHFTPVRRPELTTYLIDSLRDTRTPFIFANASPNSKLSQEYIDEVNAEGIGLITGMAPQMMILGHPATGFFISHCGSNSSAEAILNETPLVCYPFAADQGEFASLWTDIHRVALSPIQQYTPPNPHRLPMSRLLDGREIIGTESAIKEEMADILRRLRGKNGEEMRERMRALKKRVRDSWASGASRRAMEGMREYFWPQ